MIGILEKPLTRYRTPPSRGGRPKVVRDGGHFGAGLISGVSIITRGEALGHFEWVDQITVESVVRLGAKLRNGLKSRFTHPSLSADGMGTLLGRFKNFRVEGIRAVADLHFEKSSHSTPDGDLASYVMDMADEDPEAFGTSIVFTDADDQEDEFLENNKNEDGNFTSPDDDNSENLPHLRIAKLWAADVVDEPAANPDGLFRKGHAIADEADKLCEYALGLSSERPTLKHLSADADRIAQFAVRFLDSHQLQIRSKDMAENKPNETPAAVTLEQHNSLKSEVDALKSQLAKPAEKPAEIPAGDYAAERKRCLDIYSLAEKSGLDGFTQLANDAIAGGLTVEQFGQAIAQRRIASNGVTRDSGQQPDDQYAAFRKEYRETRDILQRMNPRITEDSFIRSRCRDEGLPVPEQKPAA